MSKTPHIYLFSGLGADKKLFSKLTIPVKHTHINWLANLSPKESIESYGRRLLEQIKHENPILLGVSFGGIVAIEIAKMIKVDKVIIISSVKNRAEIPLVYKLFGDSQIDKLSPAWMFSKNNSLLDYLTGVENDTSKALFHQIINEAKATFIKWSISTLVRWRHEESHTRVIHIHGDNDRLLPMKAKVDYLIKGGGHFMVYDKGKEVSDVIKKILAE